MSNDFDQFSSERNNVGKVSPRELLLRYLHFLPWFLLSLAITLTLGFLNLRYTPRQYIVSGNIQVKDPNPFGGGSGGGKFEEILFMQPEKSLNDEMQIIRSRTTASRVVKELRLQTMYFAEGKVRKSQLYNLESPIILEIINLKDSTQGFNLEIEVIDDQQFTLNEKGQPYSFGQVFGNSNGTFRLTRNDININAFADKKFTINWQPVEKRAIQILGGLKVGLSGDAANILALTYETENTKTGVDVVNQFMKQYQSMGLEDKKRIADSALKFIDSQLKEATTTLSSIEGKLKGVREKNKIYNPEQQGQLIFSEIGAAETQLMEQSVKIKLIDYLINYVKDERNVYKVGLSTLGIEEPTLAEQIGELNKLQVQRETELKSTLPGNPMIINLEASIQKLRRDILANLMSIKQVYQMALNDINQKINKTNTEISTIPLRENLLLEVARQQKIQEELFSFLLQKQMETKIGKASTLPNSTIIEYALASNIPVKPNPRTIYLAAFIIGLAIPAAIIFLIEFLNDKVRGREDVEKGTVAPILGEIGHSMDKQTLVVNRSSRKFIAEQFRIIRTNIQYVLPKKENPVILVTSSFSGEGKSFISVNMGAVMALTGKKTVILEFDIRKPKISSNLNISRKIGISNYIIGKAEFEDLPVPVPEIENLYIIPAGPIPPNPSELLLNERLNELFAKLNEHFDVVIIDTAPVGLVSDAITLGKFADATLYILRHNYTFKKQLRMIDELYAQKRLPNVSLIINDIEFARGYGGYHSYGGYGTSYGYGYGAGYYEAESSNGGWIKKALKKLNF